MQFQLHPSSVGHDETVPDLLMNFTPETTTGKEIELEMKTNSNAQIKMLQVSGRMPLLILWIVMSSLAMLLTGCNYPGNLEPPTPTVDQPAADSASIRGRVWQEDCQNGLIDGEPGSGCIIDPIKGTVMGNGVYEFGEQGLVEITIEIGTGACPGVPIGSVKTDPAGEFLLQGLEPGAYCVKPSLGEFGLPAALQPGLWTHPQGGSQSLVLLPGEARTGVNFAWDPLDTPPIPSETPAPTSLPPAGCVDSAVFVKDVTIQDGSVMEPGESFTKTWRVRNVGTCTWTGQYALVFSSGASMDSASVIPFPAQVKQGQQLDLSIRLEAPEKSGTYTGYWMLRNDQGKLFGVGEYGDSPLWAKILVEPEISEWRGEYFNNKSLDGDPARIRNDKKIDFNWEDKSPASGVSSDGFSVRWTRQLRFDGAIYEFSLKVDDGVRLWVDDQLVLDEWENGSVRSFSVLLEMARGKHDLKVEYFENGGDAVIQLDIDKEAPSTQGRWLSKFWFNRSLDSDWALVGSAEKLDFDWGAKSPSFMIPNDNFSARWIRTVSFEPGSYRFYARADDGVRVKIDNLLVLDEWHSSDGSQTYSVEMDLSGDHDLEVSYYERGGNARLKFWWESIGTQNRAPTATMDDYNTVERIPLVVPAPGVLQNDRDPEGSTLSAILVSGASNGTVELNEDGSFSFVPDDAFIGQDQFSYYVTDGELISGIVPVLITVQESNQAPTAEDDRFSFFAELTLEVPAPGILGNDFDPDSDALSAQLETEPAFGELALHEDGSFEYLPDPGFVGEDQFTYRVNDGKELSNTGTVTIEVSTQSPTALDDLYELELGESLQIPAPGVMQNDRITNGQPAAAELVSGPNAGVLQLNPDGSFVYTPEAAFTGEVLFRYRLLVEETEFGVATVRIMIRPQDSVSNPTDGLS